MPRQDPNLFKYFHIEADELIDTLARGCLALEKGGYEQDLINELNRAAHTLKGSARVMELFPAGDAAHALEDAFARLQEHGTVPTADEVTDLLEQVDELRRMINDVVDSTESAGERVDGPVPPGPEGPVPTRVSQAPAQDDVGRETPSPAGSTGYVESSRPAPKKQQLVKPEITADQLTRVSTVTLDEIGRCAGEVLELDSRVAAWREQLQTVRRSIGSTAAMLDEIRQTAERGPEARIDSAPGGGRCLDAALRRIDTAQLRSHVEGVLQEIDTGLETIGPLARRLHGLTLEAKLITVAEFGHRFEKTVRDVAIETNREVEFELSGGDVHVDRLVLQTLVEPICHLLRNSVTHGIEPPDRRRELGKPTKGVVRLGFEKTADSFRVVVEDDGAGLDADRIREVAGIEGQSTSSMGTAEDGGDISEFIFRPGMTTERRASHLAGRGIGLDVVRDAVQRLRGTVKVEWEAHRFSRFIVNVRSQLDVMDVFVVRVGGQDLLVPMARLLRTCVVTPEAIVNHAGAEAILLDNEPVQLVPLGAALGIGRSTANGSNRYVAALETGSDEVLAFVVDSLQGRRRAVIKSVGSPLASCNVLAGAAIMGDGRPGFLLDTDVLGDLAKDSRLGADRTVEAGSVEPPSILVVDDSLTTRMLEKSLLETAGYRVVLARDGPEALGVLAQGKCGLIIIDFEMPGMDGLELADRIRQIPRLADTPMIMLTSRSDDETKGKGLAAGMRAYLVKGQFDQTEFLNTVRGLIGETEVEN